MLRAAGSSHSAKPEPLCEGTRVCGTTGCERVPLARHRPHRACAVRRQCKPFRSQPALVPLATASAKRKHGSVSVCRPADYNSTPALASSSFFHFSTFTASLLPLLLCFCCFCCSAQGCSCCLVGLPTRATAPHEFGGRRSVLLRICEDVGILPQRAAV